MAGHDLHHLGQLETIERRSGMNRIGADLRQAARAFAKNPGFTLAALLRWRSASREHVDLQRRECAAAAPVAVSRRGSSGDFVEIGRLVSTSRKIGFLLRSTST